MLYEGNLKTIFFTIICICFVFYLFLGIYSYRRDRRSKINKSFFALCILASLWAVGCAAMLVANNTKVANIWRIISALGWCFFNATWISFAFSLKNNNKEKKYVRLGIQSLFYILSIIFFISNVIHGSSEISYIESYGFVDDLYKITDISVFYSLYSGITCILGNAIIYCEMRSSYKNRIRKQMKIILITGFISSCLAITSDLIFPMFSIWVFPSGIITISIGMCGMWYAINKYKMMSISYQFVSEYIFEALNEPVFILGEDFLVKKCNQASLNATAYNYRELNQTSIYKIINFREFRFNKIIQIENIINIEVDLAKKNCQSIVCELSAKIIYDEYKDVLGILILLHDVSERKKMAEVQKKYTLELENSNLKLNNEIIYRKKAEDKIRHFVYYDTLTEIFNRKKLLEDVNLLLSYKNQKFAVLFIDLDKFKRANDSYGHEAGDEILKNIAIRLKKIIAPMDTIYRIGGDEFIILLRDLKVVQDAQNIALDVLNSLETAFTYNKTKVFIGASIGISLFPKNGTDADTLINKADSGMYQAKRGGGNQYRIYSSEVKEN